MDTVGKTDSTQKCLLTVVVPTLNEAGNILELIQEINQTVPNVRIIIVDDGSSDGTQNIVKNLMKSMDALRLIDRSPARACLKDSIEQGVRETESEFVAWMDADFSHPPELLSDLMNHAQETGCAIASRFIEGGGQKKATKDTTDSALAILLSTQINFLVRHWLGLPICDFTSGFIVCRTAYIKDHRFVGDYGEYFIELMYFLSKNGIRIKEIPFVSPPRKHGDSKTGTTIWKLGRRGIKYLFIAFILKFYPMPKISTK